MIWARNRPFALCVASARIRTSATNCSAVTCWYPSPGIVAGPAQAAMPSHISTSAQATLLRTLDQRGFKRLPGRHVVLNGKVDGTFTSHHPDPTLPETLEQLRETVLGENLDLGIAFDGDGDRLGVIDNKGRVLWGDQLMMLWSEEILRRQPGARRQRAADDVLLDGVGEGEIARPRPRAELGHPHCHGDNICIDTISESRLYRFTEGLTHGTGKLHPYN